MLVVAQFLPTGDPAPALAGVAARRTVLVRPPALADLPVPPGVELLLDAEYDRAALAARARRRPDETVVVLLDDERLSPEVAAALTALAREGGGHGEYATARRAHFLGRMIPSGTVTLAWRGSAFEKTGTAFEETGGASEETGRAAERAGTRPAPTKPRRAPTRLPGHVETAAASITDTIERLQGLATYAPRTTRVGSADFVRRPFAAMARRLWHRRRAGIPGLVLSIVETYGEVLRAAQAWERDGIAARRAERQSGVPAGFHFWRTPWGSLTLRDGTPAALREALLDATPSVVAGMPLSGGRGAVWAVALGDDRRGVLRWYRRGGAIRHLVYDRYFGWTPRPIRELAVTEAVIQRGVPAPEVLAARVDRLPWGWYRGAIVTREVTGAQTFADALRALADGAARTHLITAVGRAVRDLHDRGVYHRDLNANNILVDRGTGTPAVHFIDFDRADLHRVVGARVRERELRRLERSLAKLARGGMPLGPDDTRVLRAAYGSGPSA